MLVFRALLPFEHNFHLLFILIFDVICSYKTRKIRSVLGSLCFLKIIPPAHSSSQLYCSIDPLADVIPASLHECYNVTPELLLDYVGAYHSVLTFDKTGTSRFAGPTSGDSPELRSSLNHAIDHEGGGAVPDTSLQQDPCGLCQSARKSLRLGSPGIV